LEILAEGQKHKITGNLTALNSTITDPIQYHNSPLNVFTAPSRTVLTLTMPLPVFLPNPSQRLPSVYPLKTGND